MKDELHLEFNCQDIRLHFTDSIGANMLNVDHLLPVDRVQKYAHEFSAKRQKSDKWSQGHDSSS